MPPLTDQRWLLEHFDLRVLQVGPQPGWPNGKGIYLQCPRCQDYVNTELYDECRCGCLAIDVGYARISVKGIPEATVPVCRAIRRSPP